MKICTKNSDFCTKIGCTCTKKGEFAQKLDLGLHSRSSKKKLEQRRKRSMTVCIAALCDSGIICVADREIVEASNKFRHSSPHPKIWKFSDSILFLVADDMSLQGELLRETRELSEKRQKETPFSVKDAVEYYTEAYAKKCQQHAERTILARQGLTFDSYFEKQQNGELNETATDLIMRALGNHTLPFGIETIIAGIDADGVAHICVVSADDVRWESARGYAAVGSGKENAESQFALAQFTQRWGIMDVSFLSYVAKKRAEVIEGVGTDTDIAIILPNHSIISFQPDNIKMFQKEYVRLEKSIEKSEKNARDRVKKYIFAAQERSKLQKKESSE